MTERTGLRIQAAEMSFLICRVARLSLRDRLRSSDIQEEIREELLLLHVEGNQLRSGSSWTSPVGGVSDIPIREETRGRPRTRWRDYISGFVPPGGVGGSEWGEECLALPAQGFASSTRIQISSRKRTSKNHNFCTTQNHKLHCLRKLLENAHT